MQFLLKKLHTQCDRQSPAVSLRLIRLYAVASIACTPSAWADQTSTTASNPWSYTLGMDFWSLSPSAKTDTLKSHIEENSNLFLPSSSATWHYKNASPFVRIIGDEHLNASTSLHFKARADQTVGSRIDELNVQWEMSPKLGFRAGVVAYKTSWCQAYETHSPWIRQTDTLCATKQFIDVTGGAPGLQIYTNTSTESTIYQSALGIYNPLWFRYAPSEYGNLVPTEETFVVTSNKKWGLNLSALNIDNGTELRAAYIHANQRGYAPDPTLLGDSAHHYDLMYVGVNMLVLPQTRLKFTASHRIQEMVFNAAPESYDLQLKTNTRTLELTHQLDSKNTLAASFSNIKLHLYNENFYDANRIYQGTIDPALLIPVQIYGLAWRHEFSKGLFAIAQYTHSRAGTWASGWDTGFDQEYYPSYGHALGVRLGYQY